MIRLRLAKWLLVPFLIVTTSCFELVPEAQLREPVQCEVVAERVLGGGPGPHYRQEYVFTEDWFTWNIPVRNRVLADYKGRPGLRYLEVGAYEGRSLIWMLENVLMDSTSTATAVDPFELDDRPDLESVFRANVERAGATDRVEVLKAYSQIAMRNLPLDAFDIIYIDGSHLARDVLEDAILSWRLLKEGGVLIFDDYTWFDEPEEWMEPLAGVNAFLHFYGDQMELVHCDYQLVVRKLSSSPPAA